MEITRRRFLKTAVTVGTGFALMSLPVKWFKGKAYALANSDGLVKWHPNQRLRQLDILSRPGLDNAMSIPTISGTPDPVFPNTNLYRITISEFQDQLHPDLPNPTYLWGYSPTGGATRHIGGVIVANRGTAARLRFTNMLPATSIIPVDTTLPGADQAQSRAAVHQHGGFMPWITDGGPFDWWMPGGPGYTNGISFQNGPGSLLDNIPGNAMLQGQADYFYPNDQSCRLMWYHDHAHGTTRTNAYAGIATGYLLLDAVNAHYTAAGVFPPLASTFPLVIQDKVFVGNTTLTTDPTWATAAPTRVQRPGSLWYEHVYDPEVFELNPPPNAPPVPEVSCIPEFFGDTMLANGLVFPYVEVEAKRYRFLILNACNARVVNLNLFEADNSPDGITLNNPTPGPDTYEPPFPTNDVGPAIIQIGNECGFLVQEVRYPNGQQVSTVTLAGNLILAPAERADIIIDFSGQAGKEFILYNDAPGPFPMGGWDTDYFPGNPLFTIQPGYGPDTRQILKIKVKALTGAPDPQPGGPILNPNLLDPAPLVPYTTTTAPIPPLPVPTSINGTPVGHRRLTLNEDFDQFGRLRQVIGTDTILVGSDYGLEYLYPATEIPNAGAIEVWEIFNRTGDTHPIHFHLVNVQILSRDAFTEPNSGVFTPAGAPRGPEPDELGWKETVKMHPNEVIRVIMKFDLPATPFKVPSSLRAAEMGIPAGVQANEYVYHCHILEHEEHDMMRPLVVTGNPLEITQRQEINGATGGTATFFVSGGTTPYTIGTNNKALRMVRTATGFNVLVPAKTPAPGVTGAPTLYQVKDKAGAIVTGKLYIV